MNDSLQIKDNPLSLGIKTAAIGKKGSKPLDPVLAQRIVEELRESPKPTAAMGAFFGGLFMKGITPEEHVLDEIFPQGTLFSPTKLVIQLCGEAPIFIQDICVQLLEGKTLDKNTAHKVGRFLFSLEKGDAARGLIASILRVRYETDDEYEGLLIAMEETIQPVFKNPAPAGNPIIQIAEPFDGADQSNIITPLVSHYFQQQNFRVVNMVGRNSGPKAGINLLDVVKHLPVKFLKNSSELTSVPKFGWYLNQQDLSTAIDRWVDIRREIIKRPFLATLERFINPFKSDILIASAFHPPYGEKMLTVAERMGFKGIMIIRNGIEGSIAFALKRPVKILCSVKMISGQYERKEMEFDPVQSLGFELPIEEKLSDVDAKKNAELIIEYSQTGKTDNGHFNARIQATCLGLTQGLEWIRKYL